MRKGDDFDPQSLVDLAFDAGLWWGVGPKEILSLTLRELNIFYFQAARKQKELNQNHG